jgi:hypothetical protein
MRVTLFQIINFTRHILAQTIMIIATPDQISDRQRQQASIKTQTQHLLAKLARRIEVAIESRDR